MGLLKYALMAVGIMLLLLGLIYVMASAYGIRYAATGIGLMIVGVVLIFLSYRLEKAKMSQPKLVNQNISVDTSGDVALERFKCRSCGNPLKEKDLNMVDGAVILSCPYCGNVYQLEEEPKW
jgi:membrane-bound ClpP family serine protease